MSTTQSRFGLEVHNENLPLKAPFRISGYTFHDSPVTLVTLRDGGVEGRGEAAGVYYLNDTTDRMLAAIEAHRDAIERGLTREDLRSLLPSGGARNALDCALWELESRRARTPVWQLAGVETARPLLTTFTVSADEPAAMAEVARSYAGARAIKLKLTGDLAADIERVHKVRAARPEVWLGVDANQGYKRDPLECRLPEWQEARVSFLQQPWPRGDE